MPGVGGVPEIEQIQMELGGQTKPGETTKEPTNPVPQTGECRDKMNEGNVGIVARNAAGGGLTRSEQFPMPRKTDKASRYLGNLKTSDKTVNCMGEGAGIRP